MMKNPFLSGILLITISIQSCVTPIEFVNPNNEGNIAIYGEISQELGVKLIHITRTTGFKNGINFINGAKVILLEDNIAITNYIEQDSGVYRINSFAGRIGHSYSIRIDIGSTIYQSSPEVLLAPIQPDSVRINLETEYNTNEYGVTLSNIVWAVYAGTPLPTNQDVYLRWSSEYAYSFTEAYACHPFDPVKTCYFTGITNPTYFGLFNKKATDSQLRADNIRVSSRILNKSEMKEREYLGVTQYRLSKSAYSFWTKVNEIITQNGNIFNTNPAIVSGNIHNLGNSSETVLGEFQVASVAKKFNFVTTGDAPDAFKNAGCEDFNPPSLFGIICTYDAPCFDCLNLKNASLVKPDFWK